MTRSSEERLEELAVRDRVRQVVVVVAAVAQIGCSAVLGSSVGSVARENASSILPAGYAFSIWGLIFVLSLVCAVVGLVPAVNRLPMTKATGWPISVAFAADAVWVVVFPQRWFLVAQVVIIVGVVAAVRALVVLQRTAGGHRLAGFVFGSTFGLLAGWLTAASCVGMASTLVSLDVAASGGARRVAGIVLLLVAAGIAVGVIRAGASGPWTGRVGYTAAVVWGLTAIGVEQWDADPAAAITSLVLAAGLLAALIISGRRGSLRYGAVGA